MLRPQSSESEVVQNPKVETISMAIRAQRLKLVSRVIGDYLARFGEGFSIPDLGPFFQVWMNSQLCTRNTYDRCFLPVRSLTFLWCAVCPAVREKPKPIGCVEG